MDPTYEGLNSSVIKRSFTSELGIKADGIILRHVLEHVVNPVEFLSNICAANNGKGKIYIEVPCFDWICKHRAWYDIFYEHVNYFVLSDFYRMFGIVHEAGHKFNGQYLYVVADLASVRIPVFERVNRYSFPKNFLDSVERFSIELNAKKIECKTMSVIWGGASKGVIFSLFMERAGTKVDVVVDINTAKQGKFIAATGLQVWSPEMANINIAQGSTIYVMNSNYLNEIQVMTNSQFNLIPIE